MDFRGFFMVDATDFEGYSAFCRNIGRLSQQVKTKNMKKVGTCSFSS
jgi:hypothetical protein